MVSSESYSLQEFEALRLTCAKQSATITQLTTKSQDQRLRIRALHARLRRAIAAKADVPRGYTRVSPEHLIGANMDQNVTEGLVLSTDSLAANLNPKPGKGEPRRWAFRKVAADMVRVSFPGAFQKRGPKLSGIMANPARLSSKVMLWSKYGHISLSAAAKATADEIETVCEDVWVKASRHNGAAVRSLPGGPGKPLDAVGRYDRKTMTDGVHTFQMACDGAIAQKLVNADVLHTEVDISTFGTYHMQAIVLHAAWIVRKGVDAAGNLLLAITSLLSFLPAISIGDKIVREFKDDDGKAMATSTGRAAATSFILAGIPGISDHRCRSWGVDGGGEGQGAQGGTGQCTISNKNGVGSYRNVVDVTREGYEQAMAKNGPILTRVMDLMNVPDDQRECLSARPAPKTLTPVRNYMTCPRELVIRERHASYETGRPVWTGNLIRESLPSRPSMSQDPLPCMAMVMGGVALVFDCTKHLAHTAAQHSFRLMVPFVKDLASTILSLSNVWIHSRLISWAGKVFGLADCGPVTSLQNDVAQGIKALNQSLYQKIQSMFSSTKKITKLVEACPTRWGAVTKGAAKLADRLMPMATVVPLALAEGTDQSRLKSAVSVWSKEGFHHGGKLRFSPKNGRLCWRLTDPGFIFGTHMTAFFDKCCNTPILDATSHHKERCALSIGGVGSILRRILFFLTRLMWVVLPVPRDLCNATWKDAVRELRVIIEARAKGQPIDKRRFRALICLLTAPGALLKEKPTNVGGGAWDVFYPLQYKNVVTGQPKTGLVMPNPTLGRSPGDGAETPLEHCYGPFYRDGMNEMIPNLLQIINSLCEMRFDDEERNFLPKGVIRNQCSGSQRYPWERRQVMIKALFFNTRSHIDSILKKFYHVLIDPHLFLSCAAQTESVKVMDSTGMESEYHIATDDALANAALLQIQLQEIVRAYAPQLGENEQLGQFWHGPLRDYLLDASCQEDLTRFREARNTTLNVGLVESGFTDATRVSFKPIQGLTYAHIRAEKRPKPLTAYPRIAHLAFKAIAQPRTQNRVEGGYSICSGEFRAGKRHQKGEMWSASIRRKNVFNSGLAGFVRRKEFTAKLGAFLAFRRAHRRAIKKIYEPDLGESEQKMEARMKSDLPQYIKDGGSFEETHVCDGKESNKVLKAPDRNGGASQNIRHRGLTETPSNNLRENELALTGRRPRQRRAEHDASLNSIQDVEEGGLLSLETAAADDQPMLDIADPTANDDTQADHYRGGLQLDILAADHSCTNVSAATLPVGSEIAVAASGETEQQVIDDEEDLGLEPGDLDRLFAALDAPEGFNASLSQLNHPPEQGEAESDSEEDEAAKPLSVDRFPDVQKRNVGVFKREYAEALATSRSWRASDIIETKAAKRKGSDAQISEVTLRRSDRIEFKAKASNRIFYILRTPAGAEFIRIESIFMTSDTAVMLRYSRVLCSSEAVVAADRKSDLIETVRRSNGEQILSRRSGSDAILRQLESRRRANKTELFHWGDVPWEAKASNLVGAVYWIPLVEEDGFERERTLKQKAKEVVIRDFAPKIKNLSEVDRVVVGEPFSDKAPTSM